MECPDCGATDWKVYNSRQQHAHVWRRRECKGCGFRGSTHERWALEWRAVEREKLKAIEGHARAILRRLDGTRGPSDQGAEED